jgi:hypothetical protein
VRIYLASLFKRYREQWGYMWPQLSLGYKDQLGYTVWWLICQEERGSHSVDTYYFRWPHLSRREQQLEYLRLNLSRGRIVEDNSAGIHSITAFMKRKSEQQKWISVRCLNRQEDIDSTNLDIFDISYQKNIRRGQQYGLYGLIYQTDILKRTTLSHCRI